MNLKQEEAYFGHILQSQISHYQMRLRDRLQQTQDPNLANECAICLAEIATRVQVIEEVFVAENRASHSELVGSETSTWLSSNTILASQMDSIENLYALESHAGKSFRWSGLQKHIDFVIPVKREKQSQLTIDIVAVIKPEFVKSLQIYVDGDLIPHKAREKSGCIQLFARLPKRIDKRPTQVRIVLPETLSPREAGTGDDRRKLGIAISAVTIGPTTGRLKKLLG